MAAPSWVGAGPQAAGRGAVSVAWPAGHQRGDVALLVIESGDTDGTAKPVGWTPVAGSPVTVAPSTGAGSKLQLLWKRAASAAEPAVALPDLGDHTVACIAVVRGCTNAGSPIHGTATSSKPLATTAVTLPGLTTTAAECLLVLVASRAHDANSTTVFSNPGNPTLMDLVERQETGTNQGHGGGFVIGTGRKVTPGPTGTTAMEMTVSTANACLTVALAPPRRVLHLG
jgi:hypothetical protein